MKTKRKILPAVFLFACLVSFSFLLPPAAYSGAWGVTPIRLDFSRDSRSAVITVSNDEDRKLQVQIYASEWTQDSEGKDVYSDTGDIVFFPKIMVFEKKEEKIIRAGIKIPAVAKEKTYRLFIEEIPERGKGAGSTVAIAIKFGVPIFVKPLKEEPKGEIAKLVMSKGNVEMLVKNSGNVHFRIESITVKGKDLKGEEKFSKELPGWYLLSGASRSYSAAIPQDICSGIAKISVEIKTDKFAVNGNLDVDKAMCLP